MKISMFKKVLMALVVAESCASAARGTEVSGIVTDGLGRPLEGANVRLFAGNNGMTGFEIYAETNVVTDAYGVFAADIDALPEHLHRTVWKAGYTMSRQLGDWSTTNDTVVLRKNLDVTQEFLDGLLTLPGDAFAAGVLEWLAAKHNEPKALMIAGGNNVPEFVFANGDALRPIFLDEVKHADALVAKTAKMYLQWIGDSRDDELFREIRIPIDSDITGFEPKDVLSDELSVWLMNAYAGDVSDQDETWQSFEKLTLNKTGTRAVAEWIAGARYADASRNGFEVSMSVYLEKGADEMWRPSHYIVGIQSRLAKRTKEQ